MNNQDISFYVDCMIVETIAENPSIVKNAEEATGAIGSLMKSIKDYIFPEINPNDRLGSVVNFLTPAAIFTMFSALNFTWLGTLISLAVSVFDIDVMGILRSIGSGIKGLISGGQKASPSQVDQVVQNAVNSNIKPATPEEETEAVEKLDSGFSFKAEIRDARIVKMAMIIYSRKSNSQKSNFQKNELIDTFEKLFRRKKTNPWVNTGFGFLKGKIAKVLMKIFGWVFKTILIAAGFMIAGDAISKFLGIGGSGSTEYSTKTEPSVSTRSSSQTKFPLNKSYTNVMYNTSNDDITWSVPYSNNKASIRRMLLDFAKQVYDGLDGLDNIIVAQPGFKVAVDKIYWYNYSAKGAGHVFIPRAFKSMKQIVDLFIDDVARKAPK